MLTHLSGSGEELGLINPTGNNSFFTILSAPNKFGNFHLVIRLNFFLFFPFFAFYVFLFFVINSAFPGLDIKTPNFCVKNSADFNFRLLIFLSLNPDLLIGTNVDWKSCSSCFRVSISCATNLTLFAFS